jgi:hypothetical protein
MVTTQSETEDVTVTSTASGGVTQKVKDLVLSKSGALFGAGAVSILVLFYLT